MNGNRHADTNSDILTSFESLAEKNNIIIGGSLLANQENQLFNTFYLVPPEGNQKSSLITQKAEKR